MASLKGRQRSFNRFQYKTFLGEERSTPDRQKKWREAEHRWLRHRLRLPEAVDHLTRERRDFLLEILLKPEVQTARCFGIIWNPSCIWSKGPCIRPFAHIFDRFVGTAWNISIVGNIDGHGTPGWLFEKV